MIVKYNFKKDELLNGIKPEQMALEFISVKKINLNGTIELNSEKNELCLVCIEKEYNFEIDGTKGNAVFQDMLYIPRGKVVKLNSENSSIIIYSVPSELDAEFVHIKFSDVNKDENRHKIYGSKTKNTLRHVWHFIDDNFKASRLLMGICKGEIGGWTAWPPHEHAEKREEVYVYFNMDRAFGIQLVYDDIENPLTVSVVRNGDLVSVPKGYHPSVSCPAGRICYIYCMASKKSGDRKFMDLNVQEIYKE